MIAADEFACVAFIGRHHQSTAMGTLVMDHTHRSLRIAHQNDGFAPHAGREIVARIFDLAFVPDIEPSRAEDALHLQLEDTGIGVDPPVHATGCN